MNAISRVLLVLMILFSVIHAIDFIFYGQKLQSALACVGFGLMAYDAWRNPAGQLGVGGMPKARDRLARGLAVLGMVMVVVYFVLRFTGVAGNA